MFFSHGSSRSLLETVAVGLLVLLVVAAPWPFGGYLMQHQLLIWVVVFACTILTCLGIANTSQVELHRIPLVLIPALLFVALAAAQLLPVAVAKTDWARVVLPDWMPPMSTRAMWSIDPSLTRLQVLRFAAACGLIWSASYLLEEEEHRNYLFWALAINGALLAIFGVAQQAMWNGKLFWRIELTHGGQPFASYVNRNHAAGYLNMCLASALALWWSIEQRLSDATYRDRREEIGRWAAAGLVLVNLFGVFASLSRGGILAAVVCCVVVSLFAERAMRTRVTGLFAAVIVLLGIGLAMTNVTGNLQNRMATLQHDTFASTSGRLRHWEDTFPAVLDSPMGTGLGTYRLANRPYQGHQTAGEYHNADNLYFETLIETGWGGLALVFGAILLVAFRVRWLWRQRDSAYRPLAVLGLVILLGQGIQAATDFGPLMTSNMICIAVLVGLLYAPASAQDDYESLHSGSSRNAHIAMGVLLILPSIPALIVFDHASRTEEVVRQSSEFDRKTPLVAIDSQITKGNKLVEQFPDHAGLHETLGRLYTLRYRLEMFDEIEAAQKDLPTYNETVAWSSTSLPVFYDVTRAAENVEVLREHPAVVSYLAPARHQYQLLRAHSLASPESYGPLAATTPLLSEPKSQTPALAFWMGECALKPDSSETLLAAGRMFQVSGDVAAAERAWRLSLAMNHDKPHYLLERLRPHCSEGELLSWLPPRLELWVIMAETTKEGEVRKQAATQILKLVDLEKGLPAENAILVKGQAFLFLEDYSQAAPLLSEAVRVRPDDVNRRILLATALEKSGDAQAALPIYESAAKLAPKRADLRQKISELKNSQAD
ncbi:MAG: O-antigen ligase family protein [Planctomycetaceae bacterium]|nr:O-antigen ligase family protein [Planctomycetaceae bacterium]